MKIYLAYKSDSPKLATIQKLLSFLGGDRADEILRRHDMLPYAQARVLNARTEMDRINAVGARMVAEGLPPAYAPGNEFARLGREYPDLAHQLRLHQLAAEQVASSNAQRAALSQAAGVDPSSSAAASASASSQAVDYTVVSGDTLSKIAIRHSVSVEDLRKWNDLHGNLIQVGQVLKVSPAQ